MAVYILRADVGIPPHSLAAVDSLDQPIATSASEMGGDGLPVTELQETSSMGLVKTAFIAVAPHVDRRPNRRHARSMDTEEPHLGSVGRRDNTSLRAHRRQSEHVRVDG